MSEITIPVEEAIRGESAIKRQMTIEGIGFGNTKQSVPVSSVIPPVIQELRRGEPETIKETPQAQVPKEDDESFSVTPEEYAQAYIDGLVLPKGSNIPDEEDIGMEDDPFAAEEKQPEPVNDVPEISTLVENTEETQTVNVEPTIKEAVEIEEEPAPIPHRVVGELFNCYVVVELEEKFLLVDKHAAHERINFEKLKAGMKKNDRPSQLLMIPIDVMLTSDEVQILSEYRAEVEALGFEFTTARNTVSVTAIPGGVDSGAVGDMLATMADRLKNGTGSAELTRDIIFEKALYQAACKASIKGGREYPPEYVEWLIAEMMKIPDITVCPHGRPVAMEISRKNLERQFGRA
jgi:DNA mismatch repair protein MutL